MKSYTDIEQSKKLAEILPIESADMRYGYIAPYEYSDRMYDGGYDKVPYPKDFLAKNCNFSPEDYDGELPCWSLVSLFDVLPKDIGDYRKYLYYDVGRYFCAYVGSGDLVFRLEETNADNPIDACVEMILKLHEIRMKKVKESQETNTVHGNGDNREKINSYPQRYMRDNWYND